MTLKIKISESFLTEIEDIVWDKDVNYIDAVIIWCEKHNLEIDVIGNLIKRNPVLKGKIMIDAEDLNYMEKHSRLPV